MHKAVFEGGQEQTFPLQRRFLLTILLQHFSDLSLPDLTLSTVPERMPRQMQDWLVMEQQVLFYCINKSEEVVRSYTWPQGGKKLSLQECKSGNHPYSSAQFLNSQTFRQRWSHLETSRGKQKEALSAVLFRKDY